MKKRRILSIMALIMAILLCTTGCGVVTEDEEMLPISDKTEPKAYSTATVDDDFIDNQVLVVMQPNASHLRYGRADFREVKCKKVWTLTDDYYIEKGANKALILTLRGHSKQNVIDAVKVLEQREDVLLAEPAREGTFAESPKKEGATTRIPVDGYTERIYWPYFEDANFMPHDITIGLQPYADFASYSLEDFVYVGCTEIAEDSLINGTKRYLRLKVDATTKEDLYRIVRILEQRDDARYVEMNQIFGPEGAFNVDSGDTVNERSTLNVTKLTQAQINNLISLPGAWTASTGTNSITVGIIDSGIDITHPDLIGHVNTSLSQNYSQAYSAFDDDQGHGTAVAGIVNTVTNDAPGFLGNVQFVSLKVRHENFHTAERICQAVQYANSDNIDIDILVCALEATTGTNLEDYIDAFPGVFVCSAGNDGHNIESSHCLPAYFGCENIIAVGASDGEDNIAQFYKYDTDDNEWVLDNRSDTGEVSVDLFAPGSLMPVCYPQSICSTTCSSDHDIHISSGYHYGNGTSYAAPYVAGVAALMLVNHPRLTKYELVNMIVGSTDDCSALDGYCYSDGRLNAEDALDATNDSSHYEHDYAYINGLKHKAYCLCGFYIEEYHTYNTSGTVRTCSECGYQVQLQKVEPELETE